MKGERDTLSLHQSRAEQNRTDDEEEEEWGGFYSVDDAVLFCPTLPLEISPFNNNVYD